MVLLRLKQGRPAEAEAHLAATLERVYGPAHGVPRFVAGPFSPMNGSDRQ
jgi:hypothetical protein